MSRHQIEYYGIPIEYELTRKRVKNLNIRISEEGKIFVSANRKVDVNFINNFVESKAEWIIRNLAELERYNSVKPDNEIYTGKKLYFLGEAYTTIVEEGPKNTVEKYDDTIKICVLDVNDSEYIKKVYKKWLISNCQIVFDEILKSIYLVIKNENIPYPQMRIRNMKTRWGSCKPSAKTITLNLQLIKTDRECIEQVILHELIHFIVQNHGKNFYDILTKYMPDWKERKQRLEEKYKDGIF